MSQAHWDDRYAAAPLVWGAEPNRFVVEAVEALAPAEPGSALDLAAGEGRNAMWLAGRGWRVTAVDFSRTGLDRGAARAREAGVDVTWVQADLTSYRPQERYDLVVLAYLHLDAEARRIVHRTATGALAPDGTLVVVAHHTDNLTDGWGGPQDVSRLFTENDVASDLSGLEGLTVVRAERRTRPTQTPEGERTALDTVVVVRRDHAG